MFIFFKLFDIQLIKFIIINMIQWRILLTFIYLIISVFAYSYNSYAEDIVPVAQKETTIKINSINFDNSDSIIFLGTSGSNDNTDIKITKQILTEPDRVFFDIENAVITFSNSLLISFGTIDIFFSYSSTILSYIYSIISTYFHLKVFLPFFTFYIYLNF